MKKIFLLSMLLLMLSSTVFAIDREVLFREGFRANVSHVDTKASGFGLDWAFGSTATGFVGTLNQWQASIDLGYNIQMRGDADKLSAGYPNASGSAHIFRWDGIAIRDIDTEKYRKVYISFGMRESTTLPAAFKIEYNLDIDNPESVWTDLGFVAADAKITTATGAWRFVSIEKTLPSSPILSIRFVGGTPAVLDDLCVSGEPDSGFDLRVHIGEAETLLASAVEGLELGMFISGKSDLQTSLSAAKTVAAKPAYTYEEAKAADDDLKAKLDAFRANQITATNAPKIDKVAAQQHIFSNETKVINLSGIGATSGGGAITITAKSVPAGLCAPTVTYTSPNATGSVSYTGSTTFGKGTIVVTVQQANKATAITEKIEMSFDIEVLNASVNVPPVVDKIANRYNVFGDNAVKTITLTGISPVNKGQAISTITATSDKTAIIDNPTVNISNVNTDGTAILSYTPKSGQEGAVKITVKITDNAAGTTSGSAETTVDFMIYVLNSAVEPTMFDAPEQTEIIAGTGDSKIIIPNIRNLDKIGSLTFSTEVVSGAELIDGTPTITYTKGNHFAILNVTDKSLAGKVTMRVMLGNYMQEFDLTISPFSNPGFTLNVYDVIWWQAANVVRTGAMPVYEEVVDKTEFPAENDPFWTGKWEDIIAKMTNDCDPTTSSSPCNPYPIPDVSTSGMKGFFIPKLSGNYRFTFHAVQDFRGGVWIDHKNARSWRDAERVAYHVIDQNNPNNKDIVGTVGSNNTVTSENIYLQAGKVYPIYGVRFFIHRHYWNIQVEGPGIARQIISGDMIAPLYDVAKPEAPKNMLIQTTMDKKMRVEWKAVSNGIKIAKVVGYNIYANGKKKNSTPVTDLYYMIEGLTPSTDYDVFVTSVDELGNESLISNVGTAKTFGSSAQGPGKPTNIRDVVKTGETIKLKWNKPAASGSETVAYDVDVNGVKQNDSYIYNADSFFIRKLTPKTEYTIRVRAYNASLVASEWSDPVKITTDEFNPNSEIGLELNEYRVRLNVEKRNASWSDGLGINAAFKNGSLFANGGENSFKKAMDALKPAIVRWGALDANEYGFESVSGPEANTAFKVDNDGNYEYDRSNSIGKTRKDRGLATHAMNMDYCNSLDAFYSLCIGTKDGIGGLGTQTENYTVDYMDPVKGPQVFKNLIEYLAGPATSVYGYRRSLEGFSDPVLDPAKSKGLLIEFGNEVWGSRSHNAPIGADYIAYGKWCRAMADTMRTSPYWDKIKDIVYFKYSGRSPAIHTVNTNVIRDSKPEDIHILGVGGYLGGNMNYDPDVDYGQTVGQYYRLRQQHMAQYLSGLDALMKEQLLMIGGFLNFYFYETQVSTSSYFGNLGQAVVLTDYITSSLKKGGMVPAIFCYGGGEWRINIGDRPLAHYEMARLVNTYCKGHLLGSNVETNNTLLVDNTIGVFTPLTGHEPVGASVYNNGKQWSVLLFSRDFDNEYSVELNLPDIGQIKNAKRFIVKGKNPEVDGPSTREEFEVVESNIASLKSGDLAYVPPFSMVLYTFEADDPNFEKLPLGYFDRTLPQEIELTGNFTIDANKGTTRVNVAVTPEEAFSKGIVWELSYDNNKHAEGHPLPTLATATNSITVRASSGTVCNGTYNLKATLADNLKVSKSVEIVISNQESGCAVIGVEDAEIANTLVYPNPAEDVIYVKTQLDYLATITIYNSVGMRVIAETSSEEVVELNVSSLVPGQYVVTIEENGVTNTTSFVKK